MINLSSTWKFETKNVKKSRYSSSNSLYLFNYNLPVLNLSEVCSSIWGYDEHISSFCLKATFTLTTLQMFCMLFLQSYVCQPNPQATLSNFNSLKPVIKKRQFNAVFTVFQKGFLHVFVCDFWKLFSVISAAYMKQILKEIVIFFTDECM